MKEDLVIRGGERVKRPAGGDANQGGRLGSIDVKGTPLYSLFKNANIYGGKDLSPTEMALFNRQCRELGFDPARYGIEIEEEDLEGANAKQSRRNIDEVESLVKNAYRGQFGKKGVEPAQMAETKAFSMIKVAKEAFENNHRGVEFVPEKLGAKPNFLAPEFKNNLTQYAVALQTWAQDVCTEYNNADKLSNEQLAAMVMRNDDMNATAVMANDNANTAMLAQQIDQGVAVVLHQIQDSEQNIKKQIVKTGNKVIGVVRDAQNNIINTVRLEGNMTREAVEYWGITNAQLTEFYGEENLGATEYYGEANLDETKRQGAKTRNTVRQTAQQTQELNGISEKITVNMSNGAMFPHTQSTIDRVNNMRNKILQSDALFEDKKQALTHLAAFSTQTVMNDKELADEEELINKMISPRGYTPKGTPIPRP